MRISIKADDDKRRAYIHIDGIPAYYVGYDGGLWAYRPTGGVNLDTDTPVMEWRRIEGTSQFHCPKTDSGLRRKIIRYLDAEPEDYAD